MPFILGNNWNVTGMIFVLTGAIREILSLLEKKGDKR